MTTNNIFFTHKEHYLAFRSFWAQSVNSDKCNITAAHHMVYNILRGKAYDNGFTPITRTSKLQNGFLINQGLMDAYRTVDRLVRYAKQHPDEAYPGSELSQFLSVFEGSVTPQMIAMIELPETKAMTSDYGPYKKVAQHIIDSNIDCKPITYDDIQAIYEYTTSKVA